MLCLIFVLPNVSAVRTMYYLILLPMFLIVIKKPDLFAICRSPIFIFLALYFLVFILAAPFATEFSLKLLAEHIRNSVLVASFVAMTAHLVRKNPQFPFQLFLFVGATAALVGLNNIWHFYDGLPPVDRLPRRLEGIPGLTMYYNPNWVAQLYGVVCVGTVAAATQQGARRSAIALMALSAIILFVCVMLTQTRSVLIGVVAGIAIVITLLPNQNLMQRAIQIVVIAAAALASVPFIEILVSRGDPYRLAFWQAYLSHVDAHPWTGAGLSAQIIAKAPDGFETTHPHNIIYHALLRGGVFAFGALIGLLAVTGLQAVRAWQITGWTIYPALIVAAVLPLQLEFTVVVGTSVGWDWLVLWMPIGLCLGASLPPTPPPSEGSAFRDVIAEGCTYECRVKEASDKAHNKDLSKVVAAAGRLHHGTKQHFSQCCWR